MNNYKTAHVTLNKTQLQTLKNLYIEMLDIPSIDTSLFNLSSVLIDLDYNIDFIFNRSVCNYEQVYKLFIDILYTKTYWINDNSIICFQIEGANFTAKTRSLTSVLLELFDFDKVVYACWYASDNVDGYFDGSLLDRDRYLSYALHYLFNIGNIQETYCKLPEEI